MQVVRQPAEAQKDSPVLGIIAALPQEVGGILGLGRWERIPSEAAARLYRGSVGGTDIVLSVSGMGRAAAEDAAEEVLRRFRPGAVLSIGFAGGLASHLAPGVLVAAEEIVRANTTDVERPRPDDALRRLARDALTKVHAPHFWGPLLTVSAVVASPGDKARLGAETGALAVDMESAWVGRVCQQHETPFIAVRAVVDRVQDALSPLLVDVAAGDAGWRRMAPLLARPWLLPRLLRLARAAARARASLTTFVAAFAAVWTAYAREPECAVPGGRRT